MSNQINAITVLVKVNLFNWAHLTGFLLQLAYSVKFFFFSYSTLLQRNPGFNAKIHYRLRNVLHQTDPIHYIVFLFKSIIIVDGVWVFCLMKLPDVSSEITANGRTVFIHIEKCRSWKIIRKRLVIYLIKKKKRKEGRKKKIKKI